jgi:Histidine kinase
LTVRFAPISAVLASTRGGALTLHDESAQTLAGALLTLRAGQAAHDPAGTETEQARELITETIQQLRRLALELSPKALEGIGAGETPPTVDSQAFGFRAIAVLAETRMARVAAWSRLARRHVLRSHRQPARRELERTPNIV